MAYLVTWTRPAGGMFPWVMLPEGMDVRPLSGRGAQRGLCARCAIAEPNTLTPAPCTCRRSPTSDEIRTAIAALAGIRAQLAKG